MNELSSEKISRPHQNLEVSIRYKFLNILQKFLMGIPGFEKKIALDRAEHIVKNSHVVDAINEIGPKDLKVNILDLGTGPGHILEKILLDENLKKVINIFGLDPNAKPFNSVVKRLNMSELTKNHKLFLRAAGQELPFGKNTFDMVTAFFVLHHIPPEDWEKVVVGIKEVIKPSGILFLVEDTPNTPEERKLVSTWDHRTNYEIKGDETHLGIDTWINLFKNKGYTVEKIIKFHTYDKKTHKNIPHSSIVIRFP